MTSITTINRDVCRLLQGEVDAALQAIAEKHGLTLTVAGGSFDAGRFSPKVEFQTAGSDLTLWNQYASMFDLPLDAVGREITVNRERYTILSLSLSARRFPVNVRRADGKMFRLPTATVRAALGGGSAGYGEGLVLQPKPGVAQ